MEENKKAELLKGMFAGSTFNNSVVVGIAETGSSVSYQQEKESKEHEEKEMPAPDLIARAILKVQDMFWGNSSYAIPYCVFRDCYTYHGNRSQYEREVNMLPFKRLPDYSCTPGVVSSTINDNKYMELHVDKWEKNNSPDRVIKLLKAFVEALREEETKG